MTSYSLRIDRLNRLKQSIKFHEKQVLDALSKDLGKSPEEAYLTEVGYIYNEIDSAIKNLAKWMRPKRVPGSWLIFPSKSAIEFKPKGLVLIIAPWNYPFQLCIAPLVGAIAAGNTCILKPSEEAIETGPVIARLIASSFSEQEIEVVLGGVEATQKLFERRLDHLFFTGSTHVGRILMIEAAKKLIPVTLELGGKSPCLIYDCSELKLAAQRIAWGKLLNSGQTCVAPDYVLIQKGQREAFENYFKIAVQSMYGRDPIESPDYGSIINDRHYERLVSLTTGFKVEDGNFNKDKRKIAPMLIPLERAGQSALMKDEIFGPLLPVIEIESFEEGLEFIQKHERPLAAYFFSSSQSLLTSFRQKVMAGGICLNDVVVHLTNKNLPFGGIGPSGMGAYHGYFSFQTFSHQQAVVTRSFWFENRLRYPPYKGKLSLFKKLLGWFS